MNISEGFYRCDLPPFYFQLHKDMSGKLNIWGFSVWKNQPGYRTLGYLYTDWQKLYPRAKVEVDCDRTYDKDFVREWKRKEKETTK